MMGNGLNTFDIDLLYWVLWNFTESLGLWMTAMPKSQWSKHCHNKLQQY